MSTSDEKMGHVEGGTWKYISPSGRNFSLTVFMITNSCSRSGHSCTTCISEYLSTDVCLFLTVWSLPIIPARFKIHSVSCMYGSKHMHRDSDQVVLSLVLLILWPR